MSASFLRTILILLLVSQTGVADDKTLEALDNRFSNSVRPLLKKYCLDCHGADEPEAKLDLSHYQSAAEVAGGFKVWEIVLTRLTAAEMPPADSEAQPTDAERQRLINWISELRSFEAARTAGDPGPVLARRLSNAEYNYTIRDLTGVDIRPTETFPVDPANEAGFDNSGESLVMSPALLKKYLDASRQVIEHLVLTPEGMAFAPHPVVTNTDRDKYCVKRIVEFYRRQPTDLADYFLAAWRHRVRSNRQQSLNETAEQSSVSPKYLARIWKLLAETQHEIGPLARLQQTWRQLPTDGSQSEHAAKMCRRMRSDVVQLRDQLGYEFPNLYVEGSHKGSQPFVLWKNRQYATHRRQLNPQRLRAILDAGDAEAVRLLGVTAEESNWNQLEAACAEFCSVFPDRFFVSERGRDYLDKPRDEQEKGRLLSAGFHSMMGYFRDDQPLYDMILEADQQRRLDRLWQELDFVTSAPTRQYSGFLWFERTDSRYMRDPQFDFARAEDKSAASEAMIKRLQKVYVAKAEENGGGQVELDAINHYFREINDQIRWVETARVSAQPHHLQAALDFAERAYRRPLAQAERQELTGYYRLLRSDHELTHEQAIQDLLVSVLMSPHFCFRLDLAGSSAGPRPLTDIELASRLSYFLWSSLPDRRLLELARTNKLSQPETLQREVRRLLSDDRVQGLVTEFVGNWLDFRRFEQHNSVDRERFPEFTDELRSAMFEEPIRFFVDLIQNDNSVLDAIYADHTFVNAALAQHYGLRDISFDQSEWQRVQAVNGVHRGGLLGMSVFLTHNSPGLRTSPVKRGYWVVRRVLGERIPAPPPNVPELPADESSLGELTFREVLARHRDHASCSGCHRRFDSVGLLFEGYGPVGEQRQVDLGGRTVQTGAVMPDGSERTGLKGLQSYIRESRQQDYLDTFCRKLLSYALGRSLMLSDELLIDEMRQQLAGDDYRIQGVIAVIVTSPQFLNKRGGTQIVQE